MSHHSIAIYSPARAGVQGEEEDGFAFRIVGEVGEHTRKFVLREDVPR
jgi:hypothetical protein